MKVLWLTAVTIILDQLTKTLAYQKLAQSNSIPVIGDWLKFTYTENSGMAFGLEFGPAGLMAVLSSIATLFIIIYMIKVRKGYAPYRWSLGLVLGGALGNIIDRVFYGVIYYGAPLFHGRVIDFIHFDLWAGPVPDWIPFIGGSYYGFFPIFNIADIGIVLGVIGILFFQKKYHERLHPPEPEESAPVAAVQETLMNPAGEVATPPTSPGTEASNGGDGNLDG